MYNKNMHIHFMGIGGIGMSGIAKILILQGYRVSGCDSLVDQETIKDLIKLGCTIAPHHKHDICLDSSIDTLVYSTDVLKTNYGTIPFEMQKAKDRNIPVILRATMLAEIMRPKHSIAIAGSHGKTTTSSLLSHLLLYAKLDPTIIVGGYIHSIKSNARHGKSDLLVAEADESDRSFLQLPKTFSIVTNINREHLDVYKDLEDIKQTFLQFLKQIPFYGKNVICLDDPGIQSIIPEITTPYITYGQHKNADMQIQNIKLLDDQSTFDLFDSLQNKHIGTVSISLPGIHNVLNATSVVVIGQILKIPLGTLQDALSSFTGVDRRFTYKGVARESKALIFDDYGHHPTEIYHTLQVARKKAKNRLVLIFQPQRFTRTKHLWNEFVELFSTSNIDQLIITDIYPASEQPIADISSQKLVEAIKLKNPNAAVFYYPLEDDGQEIINHLKNYLKKEDLVLLQGAGKVNKLTKALLS
ncbi:MAG: UDP-N-acetylmuramate--L-alanine ligase [Candidatus Dependentiae bacterium]|nr:UDP-N-acetylmuramate--L-alanine ligase [Candidatus Dependentiae bacterium]